MTELSGALGARFVMSGSLAKLGDAYQRMTDFHLQVPPIAAAVPVGA